MEKENVCSHFKKAFVTRDLTGGGSVELEVKCKDTLQISLQENHWHLSSDVFGCYTENKGIFTKIMLSGYIFTMVKYRVC